MNTIKREKKYESKREKEYERIRLEMDSSWHQYRFKMEENKDDKNRNGIKNMK